MWSVSINRDTPGHPFEFKDLLAEQKQWLSWLRPSQGSALLFAEVKSVVTLGARQMLDSEVTAKLASDGIAFSSGERGGNETWHGPGQWVVFVLTPLECLTGDGRGVRKAVGIILDQVLEFAQVYLPEAHLKEGEELGVWSNSGKLASIGIKIREGYVSSGFALNCIPHPDAFSQINPCGIQGALPDFLFKHLDANHQENAFEQLPHKMQTLFNSRVKIIK